MAVCLILPVKFKYFLLTRYTKYSCLFIKSLMQRNKSFQAGAALLILLTSVVLVTASFLLYRLNQVNLKIDNQKQTMKVLAEAKSALIGFAATYAERNPGQPSGFLPCPDSDGDGSSDVCGTRGHSVIGLFPWRTLGLPLLRDGSNSCLWYAVSGNYLDNPKGALSSITPGLFNIKNAGGNLIAGSSETNRAIAVIFAPGLPLAGQNRVPNINVCEANSGQVAAYLDELNTINNATGNGALASRPGISANFWTTLNPVEISTFVAASLTYEIKNVGSNKRVNQGKHIFNDTLAWITPQDYQHVYKRMEYWVAEQVRQCLNEYSRQHKAYAKVNYVSEMTTFIATPFINGKIGEFISNYQSTHGNNNPPYTSQYIAAYQGEHGTVPPYDANIAAVAFSGKYPWASLLDDTQAVNYTDDSGARFGRLAFPPFANSNIDDPIMSKEDSAPFWATLNGQRCFDTTAGFGNNQWGWWSAWQEIVFFAMDTSFLPTQPNFLWVDSFRNSTLATVADPGTVVPPPLIKALTLDGTRVEFIVIVAGKPLMGQIQETNADQGKVGNYLEDDNHGLENFVSGDLTDSFNDTICQTYQCFQR